MLVPSLRAAQGTRWSAMAFRLVLVVAGVAMFAWSFSALVEFEDGTIRPENAQVACRGLGGDGCTRPAAR